LSDKGRQSSGAGADGAEHLGNKSHGRANIDHSAAGSGVSWITARSSGLSSKVHMGRVMGSGTAGPDQETRCIARGGQNQQAR